MGGVNIGGRALFGTVPYVLYDTISGGSPGSGDAVWKFSGIPGQDPGRVSERGDSVNSIDYCDPEPSPDGSQIVYGSTPIGAGSSLVLLVGASAGGAVPATLLATQTSLLVKSMQPSWYPAGTLVVYRNTDDSPSESSVRTCDPTVGPASETILKTVSRTTVGEIFFPRFSPSGTYIAYLLDSATDTHTYLYVMNADGSGATQIADLSTIDPQVGWEYSWANASDVIVYNTLSAGKTVYHSINADGTGDTALWTDPNTSFWGLTKRAWVADDSAILVFARSLGVDPRFELVSVAANGSGATTVSPSRTSYGRVNDDLAFVYGSRVYWQEADTVAVGIDHAVVVSCATDGSDKRTELSCDPPPTGYTTVSWTGGFEGRLNQPV